MIFGKNAKRQTQTVGTSYIFSYSYAVIWQAFSLLFLQSVPRISGICKVGCCFSLYRQESEESILIPHVPNNP